MGFGLSPYGFGTPYGLGTPVTAEAPPDGPAGSRYLNPASRDYEQGPDGQLAQMPPVRQRVLIALLTIQGSSTALPQLGVRAPARMGTTFENEMRAAVRTALAQLIDVEKLIRIDAIKVERGNSGRARVTVSYTNLTDGTDDTVTNG